MRPAADFMEELDFTPVSGESLPTWEYFEEEPEFEEDL